MVKQSDIVLCNIPFMSVAYAPAGTSLLKACLQEKGFICTVKDYNIKLWDSLSEKKIIDDLENYFTVNTSLDTDTQILVEQYYELIVSELVALNPRWIGFSVFTFQCQRATTEILQRLRRLIKDNLIDAYIKGDGDIALVELLKGNFEYAGINGNPYRGVPNLNVIPKPDWSDVIDLPYRYHDRKILPITGSRGCVRHCTFCDIHEFWTKFKFRSGQNIADEMIENYKTHGITDFYFMDSLINGSMKAFRELCKTLVEYYHANNLPEKFFRWGGQFIVRSANQMIPEDFEMAAKSGCDNLCWGVESGSENVRNHMQKQFSNNDLDYCMEQMSRVGMHCYFFMIIGYPTETDQDFQDSLDMFTRYQKYAIEGTLYGVNLGALASIDDGTPLYKNSAELGLTPILPAEHAHGLNWQSVHNPVSLEKRILRRILIQEHCINLKYTVWNADMHLKRIKASYEKIKNKTY